MPAKLFSIAAVIALFALLALGGCAAASGEDVEDDGASALAENEVEGAILSEDIPSAAPEGTGIDVWHLGMVGTASPGANAGAQVSLVAVGRRNKSVAMNVVFETYDADETRIRIANGAGA